MPYPDKNEGIAGLAIDEQDLSHDCTDVYAKPIVENSLQAGKTATYHISPGQLEGRGPYQVEIPSMDDEWTDLTSHQCFGKYQVVKVDGGGTESNCGGSDDYSVVNLSGNALFKQLELYVGNGNVIDQGSSLYHYKALTETLLSMKSINH